LVSSLGHRADYPRVAALLHPILKAVVLFTVIQGLSHYRGGVSEIFSEIGFWIVYPLFIVVSVSTITDEASLRRYIWGALVGGMFIVAFGIYAVFAGLPNAIGGRAGAYGMYENHNDYTFIIIQILPFLTCFLRFESSFIRRAFLGASVLACILGVFLSLSRGGVLALLLELAFIVMWTTGKKTRRILIPLLIMFGAAAIGYQWAKRAENQGDNYTAEDAQESREELWRAGWAMVKDRPLLGVGSRSFGEHAPDYTEISHDNRGKNSHNTYIEVVATSGLLGFWAFYLILRRTWREASWKSSTVISAPIDGIRMATRIALPSIMFRALLDAKPWDWSLYFLAVVAIAGSTMLRHLEQQAQQQQSPARHPPVADASEPATVARPGRRRPVGAPSRFRK
ncbi:MAG: O-antigen ligase family protein, partial [Betaproteobacteria bacterium]|nr:O-antigen ligase family protein [Betaproteobacteria bacterium]